MDYVMVAVAWAITIGMLGGAIGGWLVFLIALVNDLRSSGRFDALKRMCGWFKLPVIRRRLAR